MTKKLAVALVLLALVAACGGGSSTTDGTTPTATSTKSIAATSKVMSVGYEAYAEVLAALGGGGAMVVKESGSDIDFTCSEMTYASFVCTGTDASGGSCTVSGSATESLNSFTMSFDCNNFHPDSDTLIDGSFDVGITVHNGAATMTTKGVNPGKVGYAKTAGECSIEDDATTFDDGMCTEGGTCTSGSTNLVAILAFTVGSDGLVVTDTCGTFTYGAGFNVDENLCFDSTTMILGFNMNGTFNGETVDYDGSWTCNYSSGV